MATHTVTYTIAMMRERFKMDYRHRFINLRVQIIVWSQVLESVFLMYIIFMDN